MSATSDAVLAAGPTVVALAAIAATVWQHKRGVKHERELADLAAVRSVLDEAALALQRVGDLPMSIELEADSWERVDDAAKADLAPIRSRLTVRFGQSHSLVRGFGLAMDALERWTTEALYLALDEDEGGPKGTARNAALDTLDGHAQAFHDAATQFLDAAAKSAGARLP